MTKYQAKLEKLEARYEQTKADMMEPYEAGNNELGNQLCEKCEQQLDIIELVAVIVENEGK